MFVDCFSANFTKINKLQLAREKGYKLLPVSHLYFNKKPAEKAAGEQYKDAACCFVEILETTSYKTTTTRPLINQLIFHPSKTNKTSVEESHRPNQEHNQI